MNAGLSLADRISELLIRSLLPCKVPLPLKYCFAFYNQMSLIILFMYFGSHGISKNFFCIKKLLFHI